MNIFEISRTRRLRKKKIKKIADPSAALERFRDSAATKVIRSAELGRHDGRKIILTCSREKEEVQAARKTEHSLGSQWDRAPESGEEHSLERESPLVT